MEFDIDLVPDTIGSGNLRSDDSTLFFQNAVTHRRISGRLVHAVHGEMKDRNVTTAASLIVLRFILTSVNDPDEKRRWRRFFCRLRFKSDPGKDGVHEPRDDPVVRAFAPCQEGKIYLTETLVDVSNSRTYEFKATLGADVAPVQAGMEPRAEWTNQESYQKRCLLTVEGDRAKTPGGGRLGEDEVYWTLQENDKEETGVSDTIQVAVLLARPQGDRDFTMEFRLEARVDWKYKAKDKYKEARGHKETELKFILSDGTGPPDNIDKDKLEAVKEDDDKILGYLSYLHIPEKFLPRQSYSSREIRAGTIITAEGAK